MNIGLGQGLKQPHSYKSHLELEIISERNNVNQNKQQSLPDNPDVHSDLVSLGSRVWPALLPAHSSASELAVPTLARDKYCHMLFKTFFEYKKIVKYFARTDIRLHYRNTLGIYRVVICLLL